MKALGMILLTGMLAACASGTVLLTGHARPSISADQVVIYTTPPEHYEVIGMVDAEASHAWTDQGRLDKAVAELKEQAASVGANGILLQGVATGSSGSTGAFVPNGAGGGLFVSSSSHEKQVSGTAIYVPAPQ